MSQDAPIPAGGTWDMIFQLQDQVKGLMETVDLLHKTYHLGKLNIPKTGQYVRTGVYTMGDLHDRVPRTKPVTTVAPESKVTKTSPETEINPRIKTSDISSLAPYNYSPLSAKSSEIRLLALETSTSLTDPIMCRLFKVSLDSAPKYPSPANQLPITLYTPLSYCWGTTSGTKHIVVDGQSFLVTPSLYSALLHFRKGNDNQPKAFQTGGSDGESYWWIDAICINQNDLDERNSQVGLMARLYKQAQMVHVWLGEESEDSGRAMRLIRDLAYLPTSIKEKATWNTYQSRAKHTGQMDQAGRWTQACDWKEMMRTADILTYLADEYHLPALQQGGIRRDGLFASYFQKATELNRIRRETIEGKNLPDLEADLPQFSYVPEKSRLDAQGVIFDEIRAINHESYLTANASNADVRAITSRWKEFYISQKEELFASWREEGGFWDKRDQWVNMFDALEVENEWTFKVPQNTWGDTYASFKRWDDTIVDRDPTLKTVRRLCPSEPATFSDLLTADNYFAALRPIGVGRRLIITSKGAMALTPVGAESGDQVCFFDGSGYPFVIRKAGDDTWVIVGQAYYFGRIVLYHAKPKLSKTIVRLV